jgi:uncharacterized membrane protein YkoI
MNKRLLIAMLCLISSGALIADDHGEAFRLRQQAEIMPLEQIIRNLALQPTDRILEIESEFEDDQHIYEIEYVTRQGQILKIEVDAKTGEILKKERD